MSRLWTVIGLFFVVSFSVFAELEVVVTASRVEEDGRAAPAYVRIISDEEIAQGNTVLDALRKLPDLSVVAESPGKEYVSFGGFGENGFGRTLILIDNRPVNRVDMATINWRSIPLDRIERIEVVKGALSSQYGDQAVSGTINIITKDPRDLEIWFRGDIASLQSNRQAFGMAWSGKSLSLEGAVSREDLRTQRDRSDSSTVSANLGINSTLGIVGLGLSGQFSEANFELPGGITKEQFDANPNQAKNMEDSVRERLYSLNLDYSIEPSDFSLDGSVSWRRLESDSNYASSSSFYKTVLDDLHATVQSDLKFILSDSAAIVPIAGIDVRYAHLNVKTFKEAAQSNLKSDESPRRIDLGFWLRGKFLFGNAWTLDAGARLSYYFVELNADNSSTLPIVFDAGLSYVPDDVWAFSVRYGRVFRYPFFDEQVSVYFGAPSFTKDLKPEYGHNFTASAEFRKGGFRASIAPYFLAMTDEIAYQAVYDSSGNFVSGGNKNIGSTYHFGALVSTSWTSDIVATELSYSFDRAQFTDGGKLIPLVPSHTIYSRVAVHPVKSLEIFTDGRFTSGFFEGGDNANSKDMIPGRFVWNVGADWYVLDDELKIYGRVLNLLDNRTPTNVYYGGWYPSNARVFQFGVSWEH